MENKTAVEWFVSRISHGGLVSKNQFNELVEQAKQLEKEQKERVFNEARKTHPMIGFKWESFDEYYKETFKSNES